MAEESAASKPRKLTKAQRAALGEIKRDGAVMAHLDHTFTLPSGKALHGGVVRRLIERGELASNQDELFGIGRPQSFRPAS